MSIQKFIVFKSMGLGEITMGLSVEREEVHGSRATLTLVLRIATGPSWSHPQFSLTSHIQFIKQIPLVVTSIAVTTILAAVSTSLDGGSHSLTL